MADGLKDRTLVIGVTGRSGSGKTSFVRNLKTHYDRQVSVHTMDNYYEKRCNQVQDEKGFINFDLPTSFYRDQFCNDLKRLINKEQIEIPLYDYITEQQTDTVIVDPAPIVIVEGLFIYHYQEIKEDFDIKVMVQLDLEHAYARRLKRDLAERGYSKEETEHRYFKHVEPSYQEFIAPYISEMDLLVDNTINLAAGEQVLKNKIDRFLEN